jgi:hypothetical protein
LTYFQNERAFTRWALKQARKRGWLAGHLSNMQVVRTRDGQTRAVPDHDARGFPDLVLVHPKHGLIVAELKMPGRKPDDDQLQWLWALREAGVRVHVWDTSDQDEMLCVLDGMEFALQLVGV